MHDRLEIFQLASGLARHAGARQAAVASNIANADTPGYKAHDVVPFAELFGEGRRVPLKATRPAHVGAASGEALQTFPARIDERSLASPNGNSVSLDTEMLRAAEVRQQHDLAVAVYRSALGVLRGALGKGR